MSSRNPTDWMWAQACEMIEQAERMHRQFFRLAASGRTRVTWEPPVDVFEDELEVVVLVALPGVPRARDRGDGGSGRARRARRAEPAVRGVAARDAAAGDSLRVFRAAHPVARGRLEAGTREVRDGCLILRLRKVGGRGIP